MSTDTLDSISHSRSLGMRKYRPSFIEGGELVAKSEVQDNYEATIEMGGLVLESFSDRWVCQAPCKRDDQECLRKPGDQSGLQKLPEQFTWRDVQPVGRLDHDTTGPLLMSDDGPFIHAQSSLKRHVPKVYQASTQDPVTEALVQQLLSGVQLHDEAAPLAAPGNHRTALHRSAIGRLGLESLGLHEGEWCYLNEEQLAMLVPA